MNIYSIFVLSSILAGVSYAADSLIKGSDATADQSFVNFDGSDITLTEVKTPAAKPNDGEPILPINTIEDDATIDNEGDEIEDEDEVDDEYDESAHDDSIEDGYGSLGQQVDGNNLNEQNSNESLNEKTEGGVDDGSAEAFDPLEPLPKDVAYGFYASVRSVTNKIHAVLAKPQDLPSIKEAQLGWDLLKQKLAILTPKHAAVADLDNLKALELKITEQLSSVTAGSVHQLRLDWAKMKKLLDGIVRLHWNIITKEDAGRLVKSVKSQEKSFVSQISSWFSGTAFPASSDNEGAAARRLLGFLE